MSSITVSAPGKVLLAGGYLVLDRAHRGLVLGLDARIYVSVRHVKGDGGNDDDDDVKERGSRIVVRSPQFQKAHWVYSCSRSGQGVKLRQTDEWVTSDFHMGLIRREDGIPWLIGNRSESSARNRFVETTLVYTLSYLQHLPQQTVEDLDITIQTDADYYSHTTSAEEGFIDFGVPLAEAHKTGLGSSAALVTALTAAVIATAVPSAPEQLSTYQRRQVHNLAQAAHCAAQGKVGSGFDVAAAVYGSCLYRRFSPRVLEGVGEAGLDGFGERLHRCVDDLDPTHSWDMEIMQEAVQLPSSLRLVMCDVDCGSETPGMAKKVLEWRKDNQDEANLLWIAIQRGTDDLCTELQRLARLQGIARPGYQGLRDILSTIRSLVREMSSKSGVPIEPPVQTELLNGCSGVAGVVGGVVPGAGGFDAVVLLVEDNEVSIRNLQEFLDNWDRSVDGRISSLDRVSLLKVRQDVGMGIKVERSSI